MNIFGSNLFSSRRAVIFASGLFLIAFGGFYFLSVPVKTQDLEKPVEQNLVNGRLAFTVTQQGMSVFQRSIATSNADGSGAFTLPVSSSTTPTDPAWSPDGTKLLYAVTQSATSDIWVSNPDGTGPINLTNTGTSVLETNPSWSAAGKIAYERSSQIWTMNADGSGQAQFTGITQPLPSGPVWSPDGTKLAFASGGEIWKINANGTGEQQVTMNISSDADPAWSPDGTRIVFGKSGSNSLGIINADGTNEMFFTTATSDSNPAWSPDGTKIAFRRANTNAGIYTMDIDGQNQVRILADVILFPTPCCDTYYGNPAWQPVSQTPSTFIISGSVKYNNLPVSGVTVNLSGTTNAATTTDASGNYSFSGLPAGGNYTVSPSFLNHYFTPANRTFNNLNSNQTGNFDASAVCVGARCVRNGKIAFVRSDDIFTMNSSDGTGQTNITNNAATDGQPNWSPDGTKIAFYTSRDGNNEIYRMNADGGSPVNLTNNAASDTGPYHSFDGASIVFSSNRDGNSEIYKMNADGSNPVRLTNTPTASEFSPAFSPDGQKIIFATTEFQTPMKLWSMNADGTNRQQFPDSGGLGNTYGRSTYSPDGAKILFRFGPDPTLQNTWTMNADGTNRVTFPAGSSAAYSADGKKVVHICCNFDFTSKIHVVNSDGTSNQIVTPSNNGNDFPHWQPLLVPRAPFDFDGDGKSDISVFRGSNGAWYILQSRSGLWVPVWGVSDDVLVPADYDGDLKTDVAVWRPSDGNFYVLNSFNSTVRVENFGLSGDVPTGGDFDGDNKADLAVYRGGAQAIFYYRGSMGNPQGNITFIPWGIPDDKPVAGDYDGDGRTDAAVFRPSNGVWYVRKSSDGQLLANNWGLANDKLVPADYDADGKTDFAVFRDGVWYLSRSAQGFSAFQFGIANDVPAPADYDGDGRADATIYRDGVWWILKSQSGAAESTQFGLSSDKPIPSAFVR